MANLFQRCKFIAYLLIVQLIGLPAPSIIYAQAHRTQSDLAPSVKQADTNLTPEEQAKYGLPETVLEKPSTHKNLSTPKKHSSSTPGKLKVVVLELSTTDTNPKVVEKVTDTLRDEMMAEPGFQVVSKEATRNFFAANPNIMQRIDISNPLDRYLAEARQFYAAFQFKDAIGVLSNTIDTYRNAEPPLTEQFPLVEAYVQLGDIYVGANKSKDAKTAFKEAIRLNPDREITQQEYAPKTVNTFVQAKQEYLSRADVARIEVFSNVKGAEIFINGVPKGDAPVKVDRLTRGDHFIIAKKSGYKPLAKKVNLKSNYLRVKMDLEKDQQATISQPGLMVKNFQDVDEQVRMAAKVGTTMDADKVVLVSTREVGYNTKITARMIDTKYYASHKPKSVEVLDLPKDTRNASDIIAKDLVTIADQDLGKNPKYADSEVIVVGKKKKTSWVKSPILWSILGVVVAGGATAGVLLGTRGSGDDGNSTTVSVTGATN